MRGPGWRSDVTLSPGCLRLRRVRGVNPVCAGAGEWGGGERGAGYRQNTQTAGYQQFPQGKLEERRCRAEFGTVDVWVKTLTTEWGVGFFG